MKKIILSILLVILVIITISINFKKEENLNLRNFEVDLSNVDNIMIVAHPDDEMIFGGSHLIDDNYLVVCITCGAVKNRVYEFQKVMDETNDKYIMLDYPDKTNGERDNWDTVYDDITKDIEKILKMKEWKTIVTHNEKGEYGHIHHKMTHNIVQSIYENNYLENDNLYFFGTYYKKDKLPEVEDTLDTISEENYEKKNKIIYDYYISQKSVADGLAHIFKYENFTKYEKGE